MRVLAVLATVAACSGPAGDRPDTAPGTPAGASVAADVSPADTTRWSLRPRQLATAAATFAEGKRLIESNCGDCMGGSSDSLRLGIDYLLGALEAGHPDTTAIAAALIDGYATQAFVYSRSEAETRAWHNRRREALETRARRRPNDSDAQFEFAISDPDAAEQRAALRRVIQRDSLHRRANGYLGLLLADADSIDAAIPFFLQVIRRGGTRHAEYQHLMQRICGQLSRHKRRVPDLDPLCEAPAYGATFMLPTGIAVSDTAGRWCGMFLEDSTAALERGRVIAIVFADSGAPPSITTTVRARRAAPCHAEVGQSRWYDYVAYDLDLFGDTTPTVASIVGLAIGTTAPWKLRAHRTAVANLFGDDRITEVRRCSADEGWHFTVWNVGPDGRAERVWHEYYDWGALVEPTCRAGESG